MKTAFDWLHGDRVEHLRFAAVLILKVSCPLEHPTEKHTFLVLFLFWLHTITNMLEYGYLEKGSEDSFSIQ